MPFLKHLPRSICWLFQIVIAFVLVASPGRAADIAVAQVSAFTGLPTQDATELNAGARAYFSEVNATGGVNGQRITLDKFDDQFNGEETVSILRRIASEKRYVAVLSPTGSLALSRAIAEGLLDDTGLVVLNVIPGSELFRKPGHPLMFHVRASDRMQLERIVSHSHLLNLRQMLVIHQDIPFGVAGARIVSETAATHGGMSVRVMATKAETAALDVAAQAVSRDAAVQSVVVVGTPRYSADAIARLRAAGVKQQIYTLSYVPTALVARIAGSDAARGVGIAQTFPPPSGRKLVSCHV